MLTSRVPEPHSPERRAFVHWLRTGWILPAAHFEAQPPATKFNPYHDPRNGQFTFGPGSARSLPGAVVRDRRLPFASSAPAAAQPTFNDGLANPVANNLAQSIQYRPPARGQIGGNSRAFQDPMTQQPLFTSLYDAPAGSILTLADNLFDLTGPAREATQALTEAYTKVLIAEIQEIDPSYRFVSLGTPVSLAGQNAQLGSLRMDRASVLFRIRGETASLQAETVRFMQRKADEAFEVGERLQEKGKLSQRLSPNEALGNFIDRRVREQLRYAYRRQNIPSDGTSIVRVNRREYDSSAAERSYRLPDARVGNIVFDVTLTQKTLQTAQVRGYFASDIKPTAVVIIRPSQLGLGHTYIISRPKD